MLAKGRGGAPHAEATEGGGFVGTRFGPAKHMEAASCADRMMNPLRVWKVFQPNDLQ